MYLRWHQMSGAPRHRRDAVSVAARRDWLISTQRRTGPSTLPRRRRLPQTRRPPRPRRHQHPTSALISSTFPAPCGRASCPSL